MTHLRIRRATKHLLAAALMSLPLTTPAPAIAGPGAHGPNGEHLDGPPTVRAASALPRVGSTSETFELVAELRASELAILIDRYESNEPVLGAKLEVESGSLKAVAAFRADQGDYVVTDAAMLKALAAPGEHGLVFTLVAGNDIDLLDGKLISAAVGTAAGTKHVDAHNQGDDDHDRDQPLERAAWIGAGVLALGLIAGFAWWRLRRRKSDKFQGGL